MVTARSRAPKARAAAALALVVVLTGPAAMVAWAAPVGDLDGDGKVTADDLAAFAAA